MSRQKRIFCDILCVTVVAGLLGSCASIGERAANAVFPHLKTYFDTEAPPTATAYPASSSISAVLGGQGEGLNCSIPFPLEWAMFKRNKDDAPISLQFRQACVYHDYCYRHGHATYGYTRADCDYALQQIAYRDCRLISDGDPQACLARARLVLLGVTLGGGKAFASGPASTYFEFDPMPAKADDYVTVRWIRTASGSAIKGHPLNGEFIVLHAKRGAVSMRTADFDPRQHVPQPPDPVMMPFPDQYIPTPPLVLRNGGVDRLVSLARDNFQNTKIKVVEYRPIGAPADQMKEHHFDEADASVFWLRSDDQHAVSYWSNRGHYGRLTEAGQASSKAPGEREVRNDYQLNDLYRTMQHMPLEGRFFDPACVETGVLKRGAPQTEPADDTGKNYARLAYLTFVQSPVSPCRAHGPVALTAGEKNEPLGIARLSSGRDVLVSVVADRSGAKLAIFDLKQANSGTNAVPRSFALPAPVDNAWLAIPPQILLDAGSGSSVVFFTHFIEPSPHAGETKARFEFQYFSLPGEMDGEINFAPTGRGHCDIALLAQLQMLRMDRLGINIARAFPPRTGVTEEARERLVDAAILGNLVERWANAQVIPGWFVKRDGDMAETGPLDVAVFFNGYSKYAFLAQGRTAPHGPSGFAGIAPSYVTCE